jgi:hypothetical protein
VGIRGIVTADRATSGDSFAGALRDAIADRGVSLIWLRDRLVARGNPVSLTTLSYWRSGRRHPEGAGSHAAIHEIEALLGLAEGALTSRIGPNRRVGPLAGPVPPFEARSVNRAAEETTAALGAPRGVFREVSTQIVADVDERGVLARRWIRMLLQVTTGTVDEYPWVEVVEGEEGPPAFTDATGARLTRTYDHPSGTAYGVVLAFERPVTAPDTTVLEWVTDYPDDDAPTIECMHGRSRPGGELMIWVRFHPDRLPNSWWEFTDDDDSPAAPQPVGAGSTIHALRRTFGPGVFGLRWTFA